MSTGQQRVATVAIVGRPNVGKSTLFNRLVGRRRSITLDTPGVTRDPISEEVVWDGHRLRLVDTGGLAGEALIDLAERVHQHTLRSVRQADLVVALLDARSGLLSIDAETVDLLTKLGLPVLYVANKTDGAREEAGLVDFCRLGIDVPLGVSAEHGHGIGELRSAILCRLDQLTGEGSAGEDSRSSTADTVCRVAIVGRPNVGKSSLLNALAGTERALVDDAPGTTRDTIDTEIEHRGRCYLFLDTAGMRRPSRVTVDVEKLSVGRSIHAVRRANVVLLLIEPEEGITDQDARIARLAWEEGRALVIAMNKIDLLDSRASLDRIRQETRERYPTLAVVPIEFLSIRDGRGIESCLAAIERADRAHRLETATADLNRILATAVTRREPPVLAGGRLRLFYVTQVASRPPTLAVFANRERIPSDYSRFLERCFRESLDLEGSPLRLRFRRRSSHSGRE